MIPDLSSFRFFIRPGITDLRKAVNGLSVIIQNEMKKDPFEKAFYLFCNRDSKLLKIVYWDRTGFCLWQKRLEKARFPWPKNSDEVYEVTRDQLEMLMAGINFFKAHKELHFKRV